MKPKRLLALGVLLVGVTAAASLPAAQKPAPPQPTEQQKLKERVDALESQLKEAQAKADRAAMEKDYIERIQKEVNAYYEKAFATQIIVVTIIGLIVGLIGKFGVDHIVQSKLTEATTTLREEFANELADELQKLRDSNAAQMKQLQDDLVKRIADLEKDLTLASDWQFLFLQGQASVADKRHDDALESFRSAVKHYKLGKPRHVVDPSAGVTSISNVFQTLWQQNLENPDRDAHAREELKRELYDGLEEELAQTALRNEWLAPLIKGRKAAVSQPATTATVPAPAQKSPEPAPDKAQPAKPEQGKNK